MKKPTTVTKRAEHQGIANRMRPKIIVVPRAIADKAGTLPNPKKNMTALPNKGSAVPAATKRNA